MPSDIEPLLIGYAAEKSAEERDVLTRRCPERRDRLVPIALDGADALRITLGAAERHGLTRGQPLQDRLRLRDPVRDELGNVRPDLATIPPLAAAGIRIRQRSGGRFVARK